MKTKIKNTVREWIPESDAWLVDFENSESSVCDYLILKKMAEMCISIFENDNTAILPKAIDIIKVVSILYQGGNQYIRNAIENEFLTRLAEMESPSSLKKHMNLLPIELRKGYLKTILEN